MRFGIAISNLSAYGGLQRDCLSISRNIVAAGHEVTILTTEIRGSIANPGCSIRIIEANNRTNPGRDLALGAALKAYRSNFDRMIGFNKLPMLDIYYSGDRSYAKIKKGAWRSFSPRYRTQMRLEELCFAPGSHTRLIMLTERQQDEYQSVWKTPEKRFRRISPNLDSARRMPHLRTDGTRERIRAALGIASNTKVWLSIGSSAWVKGFDRAAAALDAFPDTIWVVVGVLPSGDMGSRLLQNVATRARGRAKMLGIRQDIPAIMAAADVLIHPARIETTGTVIVEALANGLPVITTDTCGFAPFVEKANAGVVITGSCSYRKLVEAIAKARAPGQLEVWSSRAEAFGADPSLSLGHEEAARLFVGELW